MLLTRLIISHFFFFFYLDFKPGPNFNVISGPNGSGKTSLLEAISYLALARSFRGANIQYLIQRTQPSFEIFAKLKEDADGPLTHDIGISRSRRAQDLKIRIDGRPISKLADLVAHVCLQVIHPQGSDLITGGPELRRRFLDWGVYYAQPQFKHLYSQYCRALRQRNMLLKSNAPASAFAVWDEQLTYLSCRIDDLRQNYLSALNEILLTVVNKFMPDYQLSFELHKGAENGLSMRSALSANLEKERVLGYTLSGCHRADLKIKTDSLAAGATLSRGQLKLLVCAMRMSQSLLLKQQTNRSCIFLIDDLNSELDQRSQEILLGYLEQCRNQVFITNIAPDPLFREMSKQKFLALEDGAALPS